MGIYQNQDFRRSNRTWPSERRLAARERANELQDQFKNLIDRQQLAKIEKAEGKSVRWHVRNTMMLAKKAVDLILDSPKRGTDLKQFDAGRNLW